MKTWPWLLSAMLLLAVTSSTMAFGTGGRVVEIGPDYFIIEGDPFFSGDPPRKKMIPDDDLKKGIKRLSNFVFADLKSASKWASATTTRSATGSRSIRKTVSIRPGSRPLEDRVLGPTPGLRF